LISARVSSLPRPALETSIQLRRPSRLRDGSH
jgi:hypothetical protein